MIVLCIIGALFGLQLLSIGVLYIGLKLELIDRSHLENRVQNG